MNIVLMQHINCYNIHVSDVYPQRYLKSIPSYSYSYLIIHFHGCDSVYFSILPSRRYKRVQIKHIHISSNFLYMKIFINILR